MTNQDPIDLVRKEIIGRGRDTRYALEAYGFVIRGLEFCRASAGERRHVSGQELSRSLCQFASKQFGPMALDALEKWGIYATEDFGNIVYNLIDAGLLRRQESDSLSDFKKVLDLKSYFKKQDPYQIDGNFIKNIDGA
jgi:uncharacterized repeat protein (TIGR04138 family)